MKSIMRISHIFLLMILNSTVGVLSIEAVPIFGPEQFVRARGAPKNVTYTFTRQLQAPAYRLTVNNGTDSGAQRVSSAWVWLNGTEIIGPQDFSQSKVRIDRVVALANANELTVRLAGVPGGLLTISIAAVIGPDGGDIVTPGGSRLTLSPGALETDTIIGLTETTLSNLHVTLPTGFTFLGAVSVDLGGTNLTAGADLEIPAPPLTNGRPIVARVLAFGETRRLVLVDTASPGDNSSVRTNSPPFPGVLISGDYVFMEMDQALGIIGTYVRKPDGTPVLDALVQLVPTTFPADTPAALVTMAEESITTFIGQSTAAGFAAVPGVIPGASIGLLAVENAVVTTQVGIGTTEADILINGGIGGLLGIWEILIDKIVNPNNLNLPPYPPICPCVDLAVSPWQIPDSAMPFLPGDSIPLQVACGVAGNVTQTNFDIDWATIGLSGYGANITLYTAKPDGQQVIDVSNPGSVLARNPGSASVHITTFLLGLSLIQNIAGGNRVLPYSCIARGAVPVTVSAPAADLEALSPYSWPNSVYVGGKAGFQFYVRNNGPADAEGVILSVYVSPLLSDGNATFSVSTDPYSRSCAGMTCSVGTVPAGAVVTIEGSATALDPGQATATITALATNDQNPSNDSATATWDIKRSFLKVVKAGMGTGAIALDPQPSTDGEFCGTDCLAYAYPPGSLVTLTASPDPGYILVGWEWEGFEAEPTYGSDPRILQVIVPENGGIVAAKIAVPQALRVTLHSQTPNAEVQLYVSDSLGRTSSPWPTSSAPPGTTPWDGNCGIPTGCVSGNIMLGSDPEVFTLTSVDADWYSIMVLPLYGLNVAFVDVIIEIYGVERRRYENKPISSGGIMPWEVWRVRPAIDVDFCTYRNYPIPCTYE